MGIVGKFWDQTFMGIIRGPDHSNYTLKANLPLAIGSVKLTTITVSDCGSIRWVRWMAAYLSGLDARNSQKQVKDFSFPKYTITN